jgi:type IV pilus assembly protein PilV
MNTLPMIARHGGKSSAMPHMRRCTQGFTLVESLVALVVMSVGMLGIAGLYVTGIKSGRSALLRTQAVNLASDIADRIRSNRGGLVNYAMLTYGGAPVAQGCINPAAAAPCTSAQLAQDDLARWKASVEAALPGRPLATVDVVFTDVAAPAADRYAISVSWHEAGQTQPSTYTLVVEQ